MSTLAVSVADTDLEKAFRDRIAAATLVDEGQLAPDFSLKALDGSVFRLSEHRGKIVLLNFFTTWCGPCRKEMPHLQKDVWERFKNEDLVVASISRGENVDDVRTFRDRYQLTIPFLLDSDASVFGTYAKSTIPRNYLVDRDGTILYQSVGYVDQEFAEMIELIATKLSP